jgi:DMATS type aromatic prenyltransferase
LGFTLPKQAGSNDSLLSVGKERLTAFCAALNVPQAQTQRFSAVFELLSSSWGGLAVGSQPPWPNDICDDGTPFEFSVAFTERGPLLRLLAEPQESPFDQMSNWRAGNAIVEALRQTTAAHLAEFDAVKDLFRPSGPTGRFALWHAVQLGQEGQSDLYKVYFNPQISGPEAGPALVRQALEQIGMVEAWRFLERHLSPSGSGEDIVYFSLDLEDPATARAKVYLASKGAAQADTLTSECRNFRPGEASDWIRRLLKDAPHDLERPVLTCLAFSRGAGAPEATVHVPIRRYVGSDAEAVARVAPDLSQYQVLQLTCALTALARCSLEDSAGALTYVSLRPQAQSRRITVYLAPLLYRGSTKTSQVVPRTRDVRPSQGS